MTANQAALGYLRLIRERETLLITLRETVDHCISRGCSLDVRELCDRITSLNEAIADEHMLLFGVPLIIS